MSNGTATRIFTRMFFSQLNGVDELTDTHVLTLKEWDESKHRRAGKGDERGGEFVSHDSGGSGDGADEPEEELSTGAKIEKEEWDDYENRSKGSWPKKETAKDKWKKNNSKERSLERHRKQDEEESAKVKTSTKESEEKSAPAKTSGEKSESDSKVSPPKTKEPTNYSNDESESANPSYDDAKERRAILDRAEKAVTEGRMTQAQYDRLEERHKDKAAPKGAQEKATEPKAEPKAEKPESKQPKKWEPTADNEPKKSTAFVSPAIDDSSGSIDRDTDKAIGQLDSERHANMKSIMADIDAKLGIKTEHINAVGVWSDGAENSLSIVTDEPIDYEKFKYATALKAKLADQKDAIVFQENDTGKAVLYEVNTANKDIAAVRKMASDAGLQYHTVRENGKDGLTVIAFDQDGTSNLDDAIESFAQKVEATDATRTTGQGEFLTNEYDSRAKASRVYDGIIRAYEAKTPAEGHYRREQGSVDSDNRGSKKPGNETAVSDPVSEIYNPDVDEVGDDGITTRARVGVPAMEIPPPPPIGRMPNLRPNERAVESDFIKAYEADPHKVADDFRELMVKATKPGEAVTFGTDDAKALTSAWSHPDQATRAKNRATLNTALHQAANAIAKHAFVDHLDTLQPGDQILVTQGGCGSGKGFSVKNVPEALAMKAASKAVWDSAGDQNATENPWIQKEAEKRGLKVNYLFVHANPETQWADPKRGVVKRANNPEDGRMVDAMVYADSYAIGAKNHQAFYEKHKDNPSAKFAFLDSTEMPKLVDRMPPEALKYDRKKLARMAQEQVAKLDVAEHVKAGALAGTVYWGDEI